MKLALNTAEHTMELVPGVTVRPVPESVQGVPLLSVHVPDPREIARVPEPVLITSNAATS